MPIGQGLMNELQNEAQTTRRVLERIPAEKFDWKPHEKSMTMGGLATHVADMFAWFPATLEQDELDFAKGYDQPKPTTTEELVAIFDKNIEAAMESLKNINDETFMKGWKLRNGEQIYFELPKIAVCRTFIMNHIMHHRGQLSVYMRLNDIPVPSIYGPSADEPTM